MTTSELIALCCVIFGSAALIVDLLNRNTPPPRPHGDEAERLRYVRFIEEQQVYDWEQNGD